MLASDIADILLEDEGLYGTLSDECDMASDAIDDLEEVDFGIIVDDDTEDDEVLSIMGITFDCCADDDE